MSITPNARQRERIAELEQVGRAGNPSEYVAARLIISFERYLTSGKPSHITRAVYDYLTMRAGFIAHFNVHEFRRLYADPADSLNARHEPFGRFQAHPEHGDLTVYRDGMISMEVWKRLAALIEKHAATVFERSRARRADAEITHVRELAERHGLQVVPAEPKPSPEPTAGEVR